MVKNKELSTEKRSNVVILHKIGKTYNEIAKILKISKGTVSKTLKRNRETGSNVNKKRSGRPRKTSKRDDDKILTISSANRFETAPNIRAKINERLPSPISVSTVQRRLREKGMFGRIAVKKPLLRPPNIKKRLEFAIRHKDWTLDDWKRVLWSDESKFEIFGSHRRQHVRRKVKERYNSKCIAPTVKHGGGSVIVWGCFSYDGVGELVKIDGIMKKEDYHRILQYSAIPSGIGLIGYGFKFQQDNDPKHTSKLCSDYLNKKEEEGVLENVIWPPQSPDVNPIELLWDELKRRVRDLKPTSQISMWNCLNEVWNNLQAETLQKLVRRMPKICAALIKAKGGHFDESKLV